MKIDSLHLRSLVITGFAVAGDGSGSWAGTRRKIFRWLRTNGLAYKQQWDVSS